MNDSSASLSPGGQHQGPGGGRLLAGPELVAFRSIPKLID
jgi:hypothetical protein